MPVLELDESEEEVGTRLVFTKYAVGAHTSQDTGPLVTTNMSLTVCSLSQRLPIPTDFLSR